MTHGSLFSGIGGFDLAAEWMGWENKFHCEWNSYGQRILKQYWPMAETFTDITKSDFKKYANRIDILTGGDPCQPSSKAGKQKGFNDPRFLWPEKFRAVREISPTWIVNENVRETINNGMLDKKISDLESIGYTCWPPFLIPAGSGEALCERFRVWLVARSNEDANSNISGKIQGSTRKSENEKQRQDGEWMRPQPGSILTKSNWKEVASEICGSTDGLPFKLDRNQGIGNAIDPRIALEIFKAIQKYEDLK